MRIPGKPAGRSLLRRPPVPPSLLAYLFLALVGMAALVAWLPLTVLWLYLAASAITFLVYAADKSAARHYRWRTRERTLHLLGLIGGWPGALAAQQLLRHKSAKPSFQAVFWLTVVANVVAVGWLVAA